MLRHTRKTGDAMKMTKVVGRLGKAIINNHKKRGLIQEDAYQAIYQHFTDQVSKAKEMVAQRKHKNLPTTGDLIVFQGKEVPYDPLSKTIE